MTAETTYEYDLEIYNNHERYASWIASIKAGDRVGVTRRLTLEGEPTVGWVYRRLPNDPSAVIDVTVEGVVHTYEPGGSFEANHWVENTPKEKLVPGDQRLRLVPIRAVERVYHAPVAGEYTVSVVDSPVRVEVVGQVALVRCPIHSRWQTWAKAHGGKWDATAKAWRMDVRDLDAIRAELIQRYGCDGSEERVRAVDVRVDTDLVRPPASSEWHLLGRKICGITPYGNFRMGDAVVVIRGKLGAQRTNIHAEKGTIIEVRGVPLAKALLVGESSGWKGLSFVKRGERVEALLDQGQPAPAPILAPGARDLPPMRTGRSGQAPSAAALVHRAHLIAAIKETLEDLSSSQGTSEEERTIQALVKAGPDELRELLLELDGDWWTQDAQHDAMRGRPVPLLFRLDRWVSVGLGGSSNRATDAAAATAIMGLVARQLVRGTATTNTTPNTPVSITDTPIVEVEKEVVSITDTTPADEGEVGSLSVVDTTPLVEVEDTPAPPTAPSTRRRSRKRDLTDGLVDTKPVRGADILVPAAIPFAQLDSTPVSAADVCRLRATLGLTTTQFGVLLGSSRQRVYVWETEGTTSAHGSISALIRLYLAQLPPLEEQEETQAEEVEQVEQAASEELTQDDRTQAQTELLDAQTPRAERGGVWGFGWWREEDAHTKEWHLYYKTPYQAEIARALEATPQATWDKQSMRWELPDTEGSVQLLEGLVRAHWGFELKDVVYVHLDDVGRGWRATPGELWELSRPRKDAPDGVWGRVIAGQGYREQSDGWHDGWHAQLWVRRVGEEDEGARAKIEETRAKAAELAEQLRQAEEQAAADAAHADAILADWAARGLTVKLNAGYNMPAGDYTLKPLLRHHTGRHSYNNYSEAAGTLDDGLPIELGQVHAHIDSDWWDTAIYVRAEDADRVRVAQVCSHLALRRGAAWRAKPRIEQLHDACEAAREHYASQPEYLAACEAALALAQA